MVLSTLKSFLFFRYSSTRFNDQHQQHLSHTVESAGVGRFRILLVLFCLTLIAIVSAHDTYLAVDNEQIMKVEKNPICLLLIQLEPENFTFFILGKSIGTIAVVVSLALLIKFQYRHASLVTYVVAAFQVGLLGYLHLSDPLIGGLPNLGLLFRP